MPLTRLLRPALLVVCVLALAGAMTLGAGVFLGRTSSPPPAPTELPG